MRSLRRVHSITVPRLVDRAAAFIHRGSAGVERSEPFVSQVAGSGRPANEQESVVPYPVVS